MLYDAQETRQQLGLGEDGRREFKQIEFAGNKPKSPRPDDLADTIAAFANAAGGVLFCGVTDAGEVQAMSRAQLRELDTLVAEVASAAIKPPVRVDIQHVALNAEQRVLVVVIPKGDSLYESPGGACIRVGSSKRKMQSDEQLRLAQKRGQARHQWFDEQPLPGTGFATLDEKLWKPLISAAGATDPKTALEKMTLLAADDAGILRATVAGVLLCAREPEQWLPGARIIATCYRGLDRASGQADAQEICGPLQQQVADAVAFTTRNTRVLAEKLPARLELPQYSAKTVFEALVNAVAHRDYTMLKSRIRLSMFADRLELQSPGALPNNLTIDNMPARQATRNEVLTSALAKIPTTNMRSEVGRRYFMEQRGDGVPLIQRETYGLSGKYPNYSLLDDAELRLIIPAATQESSVATTTITVHRNGQPMPDAELLVLFPNTSGQQAITNADGVATINLYTNRLPMVVFAAAAGYAAHVTRDWIPRTGPLTIKLKPLAGGGSTINTERTARLPALHGHLELFQDSHDRVQLYAGKISINEGQQQPVSVLPGEELQLVDAHGAQLWVRIIAVIGRSALLEYTAPPDA